MFQKIKLNQSIAKVEAKSTRAYPVVASSNVVFCFFFCEMAIFFITTGWQRKIYNS